MYFRNFLSNKLGIKITRHRAISVVTFALRTTVVMKKVAIEKKRHVDLYIYPQKEMFLFRFLFFTVVACLCNFFFSQVQLHENIYFMIGIFYYETKG